MGPIPILTLVVFLPLAGAFAVAAAPARYARPLALAAALATWVVSLFLLVGFDAPEGQRDVPERGRG